MMRVRPLLWLVIVLAFSLTGSVMPVRIAASAAKPSVAVCGVPSNSHQIVGPPDVEMWKAPIDASGVHELILGVHNAGDSFCYRYAWKGNVYSVAPTIHVRRGERFAIRIADDLIGQSAGESVPSTAMLPCKPMYMPHVPVEHWVGYLNHVIDDRQMHVTADTDTNLHLHGFEGPASMENVFLSALSTPLHACEYVVTIPRTQPPGIYLYHPHIHGSSDDEVAGGLDGAWIVDPDTRQISRSAEHVLVIRYQMPYAFEGRSPDLRPLFRLTEQHEGALAHATPVPYDPFDPPPWPVAYAMHAGPITLDRSGCNGALREPIVAIDGALIPASLSIPAGQTQLLRIVNGTSDSAKLLELRDSSGRRHAFHVVGIDGVPISGNMKHPLARYLSLDELMLSPMSRADVLFTANAGSTYTISSEPYCQGTDGFLQTHRDLLHVVGVADVRPEKRVSSRVMRASQTPAAALIAFVRAHPALVHRRAITFTEYAFPRRGNIPAHQAFYITDTTNPNFHEHPFWPIYHGDAVFPSNPDIVVKQGTIEEWYLINASLETHAFHIHQMAFVQERTYMGVPATLDTVFVPVGTVLPNPRDPNFPLVRPSITRVILDFRHVPKGEFVFHCHMLYHEDHGMMGVIRVE
jgi:FtsP/CotA-like multicopper oxidase with cupredoxin domain